MPIFNIFGSQKKYTKNNIYNSMYLPNPIFTGWILEFRIWNDAGKWLDTEFWKD